MGCVKHIYIYLRKERRVIEQENIGNCIIKVDGECLKTQGKPYKVITKDTCEINKKQVYGRDVILIDDIYTENVNIAEDIIQTIFDLGAKKCYTILTSKNKELI